MAKIVAVMILMMMMSHDQNSQVVAAGGLTCGTVIQSLLPCLGYIKAGSTGRGESTSKPVPACCDGVRSLKNIAAAGNTADRQTACACLKKMATGFSPPVEALAATIPAKCGVPIPYKIDPAIDCSKIV